MNDGTKPTIAIDIDDVIAANAPSFVEFSNTRYGTNLTVEDYQEHWMEMWKTDVEEVERRANEYHSSGHALTYQVIHGAREALSELKSHFRLIVLTTRRAQLQELTHAWLDRYYPEIFDEVVFTGFFDNLTEGSWKKTKGELAKTLGAEYLIDDQPKHIIGAAQNGVRTLLFGDYAWNRNQPMPAGVVRVRNWEEVRDYFKKIAQ